MRLALTLMLLAAPAWADGTIIVSPIYSQLLAVPVPSHFKAGFEHEKSGSYILELTPASENVDQWSQLITVTGAKGLAAQYSVIDMASNLAEGYQAACPTSFTAHQLPPPKVRGATAVFSGYLGCGTVGGQSEAMVFVVLQGKSEIYTVQWAEHGPAQATPMEPDPVHWRPRADTLALARICDKVAGEAAPYPSCTE
ncbi:MAG: hypothetical protein ABI832_02680 [bacterium]